MKQKHLIYIVIGVVILWITIPICLVAFFDGADKSGSFGDTFGVVNALFSSLAFALLIYTAWMQKEELSLQREELKLTREEIAKSAKAQTELAELTKEQLDQQRKQFSRQNKIRMADIKPELSLSQASTKSLPPIGNHLALTLKVEQNKLQVTDCAFPTADTPLIWENKSGVSGRYFQSGEVFNMRIKHASGITIDPTAYTFAIIYVDADKNYYKQQFVTEAGKIILKFPELLRVSGQLSDYLP